MARTCKISFKAGDILYEEIQCMNMVYSKTCVVCLFDLILYVTSTIFQLNRDGSFWVVPVLS